MSGTEPSARSGMPAWVIVSLSIVGVFVLIGGALVLLAIHGLRRYHSLAKQAEARNSLGMISRAAVTAYDDEDATLTHKLCPSGSQPVPIAIASVRGKRYASTPSEWRADRAANAGFACLKFEMSSPQFYQYSYAITGSGSGVGDTFTGVARGDLNGDGVVSTFTLSGAVGPGGVVTVAPLITETNPEE